MALFESRPNPVGRVDYDRHQHRVYAEGRRMLPATAQRWREAIRRHAEGAPRRRVLDLGAGTGRFSQELSELLEADVIAAEPSAGMRRAARSGALHARVQRLGARAEQLPLRSGSLQLAWLSMVLHHLDDIDACAHELRRVLQPGGRVLIRSAFQEHLQSTFYRYFAAARRTDARRLPVLADTVARFESCGLPLARSELLVQQTDASLADFEQRMRARPFSTFELMSEDEIAQGMAALRDAVASGVQGGVHEAVHLLSFRAPQR